MCLFELKFQSKFKIVCNFPDNRDIKRLAVPFLRDNHPEDMYMYEMIVETGPSAAHATTSQIYFVLTGEDEDTGVRCFTDPNRKLFKAGGIDSFLLTTEVSTVSTFK